MKRRILLAILIAGGSFAGPAWAFKGETTVTGVISNVDAPLRRATVTPTDGAPVRVQFVWNVGGVCSICGGQGFRQPIFDQTITDGSTWTVVYTTSYPDGGTNTVNRVIKPGAADTGARAGN